MIPPLLMITKETEAILVNFQKSFGFFLGTL
jgi:hypothetical protein